MELFYTNINGVWYTGKSVHHTFRQAGIRTNHIVNMWSGK